MIVVDFTAIACLLIKGPRSSAARRALATDDEWVSARIWRQQLLDVLSSHIRSRQVTVASALHKIAAADFALRTAHEVLPDQQIFMLSQESQLSASQVTYLLTAQKLGTKLVTADDKIFDAFPGVAVSIETFGAN